MRCNASRAGQSSRAAQQTVHILGNDGGVTTEEVKAWLWKHMRSMMTSGIARAQCWQTQYKAGQHIVSSLLQLLLTSSVHTCQCTMDQASVTLVLTHYRQWPDYFWCMPERCSTRLLICGLHWGLLHMPGSCRSSALAGCQCIALLMSVHDSCADFSSFLWWVCYSCAGRWNAVLPLHRSRPPQLHHWSYNSGVSVLLRSHQVSCSSLIVPSHFIFALSSQTAFLLCVCQGCVLSQIVPPDCVWSLNH